MSGRRAAAVAALALLLYPTSAGSSGYVHRMGSCWVTGYAGWGTTASGRYTRTHHTVATDPYVIPMYSHVRVSGLGTYVAEDTGGAVRGCHIDVFVSSDTEAYALTGWRLVWWWR